MTLAPGMPSSRPTSSVTCSNTRLGGASLGDERGDPAQRRLLVGERALGRRSPRAPAARVRSAVTAASTSDVSAEMAMNSCVASRLSVIESRTNGPSFCAVFHTVIEQTTRTAVAAPRGPKRSAAHSSTGKTT